MSTSAVSLTAVVPCYQEVDGLARLERELIPSLEKLGRTYEILAIDDGSTDGTGDELVKIEKRHGPFTEISHSENKGLGAAIRTGIEYARGEWIACLDADLTFHPDYIAQMFAKQAETGADCVSGSPFAGEMSGVALGRRVPSLCLNAFYRGLLNRNLTSFTPLFRLYRADALRELKLSSTGFEISVEIIAKLLKAKRIVAEIPVRLTERETGQSKLNRLRELKNHAALTWRLLTS